MKKILHNLFDESAFNEQRALVGANLIAVYHTVIDLPYFNPMELDPRWNQLAFAFFIVKGSVRFSIDGKEVLIPERHVVFGRRDEKTILLDNGNHAEFVCFHFQLFNYKLPLYKPFKMNTREKELVVTRRILRLLQKQTPLEIGSANALFMELLFDWLRTIRPSETTAAPYLDAMKEAELYINEHIEDTELNVTFLAKKFNFCETHFRNLFKRNVGTPPKQYIEGVRLEHARALLQNSSLTVTEISERLNFSSSHHFANAFKKMYSITPREYRKNRQKP